MEKLYIEYKNVKDVFPYDNNPRDNDNAVAAVAKSIKEFGFKDPIIIDKDGVIIAGHTRLKAAKVLGLEKVPTVKAEDLTEEQIKAFRLAHNKTAELAEWDYSLLNIELEAIDTINMAELGFNELDIESEIKPIKDMMPEDVEKKPEKIKCPCCGFEFEL